jgi:hypothetical protein
LCAGRVTGSAKEPGAYAALVIVDGDSFRTSSACTPVTATTQGSVPATAGWLGQAWQFGAGGIDVAHESALGVGSTGATFAYWVRSDATPVGAGAEHLRKAAGTTDAQVVMLHLGADAGADANLVRPYYSVGVAYQHCGETRLTPDDGWVFLALTVAYDSASGKTTATFYRDDLQVAQCVHAGRPAQNQSAMEIGKGPTGRFRGALDELVFYGYPLPAADVVALWEHGIPIQECIGDRAVLHLTGDAVTNSACTHVTVAAAGDVGLSGGAYDTRAGALQVPHARLLDVGETGGTFSYRVRVVSTPSGYAAHHLLKGDTSGTAQVAITHFGAPTGRAANSVRAYYSVGGNYTGCGSWQLTPANGWVSVALTYAYDEGANRTEVALYRDGTRTHTCLHTGRIYDNESALQVGGGWFGTFPGLFDDVVVYRYPLPDAEIAQLHAAPIPVEACAP